jgi:hypothetical protein
MDLVYTEVELEKRDRNPSARAIAAAETYQPFLPLYSGSRWKQAQLECLDVTFDVEDNYNLAGRVLEKTRVAWENSDAQSQGTSQVPTRALICSRLQKGNSATRGHRHVTEDERGRTRTNLGQSPLVQ